LSYESQIAFENAFPRRIAALLVIMGMNNRQDVALALPPILKSSAKFPAAIMYLSFVAIGFITGTVATAGGGKRSSKSKAE